MKSRLSKFLVIKRIDEKDYFHSIEKGKDMSEARSSLLEKIETYTNDSDTTYLMFPMVPYEFDANQKIVVPKGTPMCIASVA